MADGYVPTSAAIKLQLAAHFSRWLGERGLVAWDVTEDAIDGFLVERRATHTNQISLEGLGPFLEYLRSLKVIPEVAHPLPVTDQEILMAGYQDYLLVRRGLSSAVIVAYGHWISPFLDHLQSVGCHPKNDEVTGEIIADYLTRQLVGLSRKSAKMTTSVLRSFLGYLHASEYSTTSLTQAVPPIVSWQHSGLPQPLSQEESSALLAAADRSTTTGKRDYVVVLLLLRMALRRQEVALLRLEDLNWVLGTVLIHGKGGRTDTLPLPVEIGEALVDYLMNSRPPGLQAREVFIRTCAPFRGLTPGAVTCIVARLARRVGLGTIYAHRLRHMAASNVLNAGASMEEVAQFRRHTSTETSTIYAKTDMTRLAGLSRPWPTRGTQP